jgi:uncharacterized protein (TIGR02722 family)
MFQKGPAGFLNKQVRLYVMIRVSWIAFLIVLNSCQPRTVTRIDPNVQIDLSGRWNDSDSRMVADQMIQQLFSSEKFKEYIKENKKKPSIIVGVIRNRTSEHIDVNNYLKRIEAAIHNSDFVQLVESEDFRDKIRLERAQQQDFADPSTVAEWGKEIGADLMLLGEINSEVDTYNTRRVVNYIATLFLTNIETNKRVWYGQNEIKKLVKN